MDGHMVFVNSLALERAGIDGDTPPPQGGEIIKDPVTGEPTGILKDEAMSLVTRHIPEPSREDRLEAARKALAHAASYGVTSVHDMTYEDPLPVYRELLDRDELTARLCVYRPISTIDRPESLESLPPSARDRLKVGGLKGFVDGSLGSFTALFFEPYTDDPRQRGLFAGDMFPEGIMERRLREVEKRGLQAAVHAIGDRANHVLLDMCESILSRQPDRNRRWRVEHAQHLAPADIPRFGRLGILASVQPYHCVDDGRWAETKIGPARARTAYAFRSLLETGARLVFGSDWTVAPLDPLAGMYAAVTRRTLDGRHPHGWIPEEKIPLEAAIEGYTVNGAYAEFAEDRKGSIREGMLADLVVLDRNILEIPPEDMLRARVLVTVCDGRIVFRR
jgi:predicted amidohydrolase YtcJ